MRLVTLGSGSAFTTGEGNWQSNFLLETSSGRRLLVDCGGDARLSLEARGLGALDIDALYLSHLHSDHIGGLEWLAFSTYFDPSCPRPRLYACADLLGPLWHHALKAGLGHVHTDAVSLETYFDVQAIEPGGQFDWHGRMFQTIPVLHIGAEVHTFPSYGLSFPLNGRQVFVTTDTQFTPDRLMATYRAADIILHDCETARTASGVHAHYTDLMTLPAEIKRKTWLYHYQPGPRPDALADGFCGFVGPGQEFT